MLMRSHASFIRPAHKHSQITSICTLVLISCMTTVYHLISGSMLLTLALSSDVADGAPLSELSWPSSLAVVAVSFSGLFTFIFLMLACLCCKKGDIGFKVSSLLPPTGRSESNTNSMESVDVQGI